MASSVENRGIKVYLDSSGVAQGMKEIVRQLQTQRETLARTNTTTEEGRKKADNLSESIKRLENAYQREQEKITSTEKVLRNLSGSTYNELIRVKRQLQEELRREQRGTEKYQTTLRQYERVCRETAEAQREMNVEVGCNATAMGKAATFVNKYIGVVSASIASVLALRSTIQGYVGDFAKMQEAQAGVMKYTGMTADEVDELNESLMKMDTRTSREQLNALAGDAGRLGITSKEAILEFVDAADKINVALGEDLGEDAVANIGKLAQMFGESERLGLRGAMLATGSAINEVAQSCSASEVFLTEFTARVAGVAKQAGISQANIMGFAASMDENMMRDETSATAYQNILMKMFTNTTAFARAAGLEVKEFASLVKRDANEALLQFAEGLNRKGGMADLAPIFGDLKTQGAGVSAVLSIMAGKASEIRERQQLANRAYEEGTSILNEFAVQNNTVQAGLDKTEKKLKDLRIEVGEKLVPAYNTGAGVFLSFLKILLDHKGATLGLISAVTLLVYWQKLVVMWNKLASLSFRDLKAAMASTGIGAVAVLLGTLVGHLVDTATTSKKAEEGLRGLAKINQEAGSKMEETRAKVDMLTTTIHNGNLSIADRRRAINDLKAIIPGYHASLTDEGVLINNNTEAIKLYLVELEKQLRMEAAKEELLELYKQQRKANAEYDEKNTAYEELYKQEQAARDNMNAFEQNMHDLWNGFKANFGVNELINAYGELGDALVKKEAIDAQIEEVLGQYADAAVSSQPTKTKTTPDTIPILSADSLPTTNEKQQQLDELQALIDAENALYEQQQYDLKEMYANQRDENLASEADYNQAREQLEMLHLERTLEIAGLDADARREVESRLLDFKIKCLKEAEQAEKRSANNEQKQYDKELKTKEQRMKETYSRIRGYSDQFGTAIGNLIAGQEDAVENLGNTMVDIVFDVLDKLIDAWITQLVAKSIASTAEGTMQAVGSKGIAGLAEAAAIGAAITAALAAAKAGLKSLIGSGKKESSVGGSSSESSKQNIRRVTVPQHAAGRYEVIGADDGLPYSVPYLGEARTGVVRQPALVSETGAELIVTADDLLRLQRHVNYPLVLEALNDARSGRVVPQHGEGSYSAIDATAAPEGGALQPSISGEMVQRLAEAIERLSSEGVAASVSLNDLERKQQLRNRARSYGSKRM